MYHVCRFDGESVAILIASFSDLADALEFAEEHAGEYSSGLEILDSDGLCYDQSADVWEDLGFVFSEVI